MTIPGHRLAVLAAGVLAIACREPGPPLGTFKLGAMEKFGVAVDFQLTRAASPAPSSLCGRFAPTRPGFHLYAMELPEAGVRGIGRPTRIRLVRSAVVHAAGQVVADRSPEELKVIPLGLTFPVYPAGPVTLCMPVTIGEGVDQTVELAITYMTCSDQVCLPPVQNAKVVVSLGNLSDVRGVK